MPGGIYLSWFIQYWGGYNAALDRNALADKLEGFQKRIVAGIAPVNGHEDLLPQAIASHAQNYDVQKFLQSLTYRDEADASGLTLARMSPFTKSAIAGPACRSTTTAAGTTARTSTPRFHGF